MLMAIGSLILLVGEALSQEILISPGLWSLSVLKSQPKISLLISWDLCDSRGSAPGAWSSQVLWLSYWVPRDPCASVCVTPCDNDSSAGEGAGSSVVHIMHYACPPEKLFVHSECLLRNHEERDLDPSATR